jgi:uncharacterized protein (TIGR02118 family)
MIKLIALLKRKPGMTREEFNTRWLDEHTKISSKLPGCLGYRINLATSQQPAGTGEEPQFDGTAELWWESIEAMEASFDTEIGKLAGADGDSFTSIRQHIYTEEHNVIPGPGEPPDYGGPVKKAAVKKAPAKKAVAKKAAAKKAQAKKRLGKRLH